MERMGKYYKLYSMNVNGIKYYFIGSIKKGGFMWVYTDNEKAVDMFEKVERHAEKHGEI